MYGPLFLHLRILLIYYGLWVTQIICPCCTLHHCGISAHKTLFWQYMFNIKKIACTLLCLLFYNLDFTTFSPDKKTILRNIAKSSKRGFKKARKNQFLTLSLFMKFTVAALLSYVFLHIFSCTLN